MTNKTLEILVVEDDSKHIESAREDLAEEGNLTIVSTYKDAINYLNQNTPDVVLTDERIPFASGAVYPINPSAFTGKPLALGSKIVLYAIAKNVPNVAMISDTNHHSDEIAATQDDFSELSGDYGTQIGNTNYFEKSSHLCIDGRKMYKKALKTLLKQEGGVQYAGFD